MPKTKREQILAVLFCVSMLIGTGWNYIAPLFAGPFQSQQRALAILDRQLSESEVEYQRVQRASRELLIRQQESLPSTPSVAISWYQKWLMELLEDSGWQNAIVTPGKAWPEKDLGHRLPFTVQGDANTLDLAAFIDVFNSTPLLHKVTALTVQGAGEKRMQGRPGTTGNTNAVDDESSLRIVLAIEALALSDAPAVPAVSLGVGKPNDGSMYQEGLLTKRWNLHDWFSRPKVAQPASTTRRQIPATASTPVKAAPNVQLVASIFNDGKSEAWLLDLQSKKMHVVNEQRPFQVADVGGRVLRIEPGSVTMEFNGGVVKKFQIGNHILPK